MEDIRKRLEQEAQVINTERMPMGESNNKAFDVASRTTVWMADQGFSLNRVAKLIGEDAPKLSLILRGKYTGSPAQIDKVVNKLVNLMESRARKEKRPRGTPYIETSVAKAICSLIRNTEALCDDEGKIGVIIGDSGHGKSHCLRAYAQANRNTVYVQLDDAMTPTIMFGEIARAVGLDGSGSIAAITRRLIEGLQNRQIIVLLDECSGLKVKHLNQLRQILVVKARCPLIVAGNADLLKTVSQPTTRYGHESLDQFRSRSTQILDLDKLAGDKGGGLYTPEDIRKLYQYGGVKLTGDAVSALQRIARTRQSGRLRTCHHIVASLHASKVTDTGQITADLIAQAIQALDLPVNVYLPTRGPDAQEEQEQQIAKTA